MPGTALVTAASGLGDILRITPLIRVCAALGYQVDVLLAPDYPETSSLLEGAPEIRRLFRRPGRWKGAACASSDPLPTARYDLAIFTYWSSILRSRLQADRSIGFDPRKWLAEGDHACVVSIARALGWNSDLPEPFAMKSARNYGLKPGTLALHPGCKPDWPWKKWHGSADLARELPDVVVLGTPADFDNSRTYFQKNYDWPCHVRDYSGQLSLRDAAALLAECAALVSNDSGIMHLGAALGVPTFGIFGITSPLRELTPRPNLFAITKGLPCESACHKGRWGRRDCENHLLCLKTLTAREVLVKVRERVALRTVVAVAGN